MEAAEVATIAIGVAATVDRPGLARTTAEAILVTGRQSHTVCCFQRSLIGPTTACWATRLANARQLLTDFTISLMNERPNKYSITLLLKLDGVPKKKREARLSQHCMTSGVRYAVEGVTYQGQRRRDSHVMIVTDQFIVCQEQKGPRRVQDLWSILYNPSHESQLSL